MPTLDPSWSLVLDEQWATVDPARWYIYNNSNFGAPTRVQIYKTANVITGAASSGATGGTSLIQRVIETDAGSGTLPTTTDAGTRYSYTGGMLDSKHASTWYPRYCRVQFRCKIPHGQGIWPSYWLTAKNGGATTCEIDLMEYFHAVDPGKNKTSVHGTDNTVTYHVNRWQSPRYLFEAPTLTPDWHTFAFEILPVTDLAGATVGDPHLPSDYVRITCYVDDVQQAQWVDPSATWWTTNGGTEDSFWNFYIQGAQIDGQYVGHPRSALGYDHWRNACLISGTPPSSCTTTHGGYTVQRGVFSPPSADTEMDYLQVWKWAPGGGGGGGGPAVFTLDPVDGVTDIDTANPTVGTPVPDLGYSGLFPVDGLSAVTVTIRLPHAFALDPIDGVTTIGLKITPDLADAPPISMGFYARCFAILLPPVQGF